MTDAPKAKTNDPWTSHDAAEKAVSISAKHRELITKALASWGPGTAHEIADRLRGIEMVQVNRRLIEMERAGQAVRLGDTRRTPSGRSAMVWRLT